MNTTKLSDLPLVQWQDESGAWRQGVVVCLVMDMMNTTLESVIRNQISYKPPAAPAIRAIVIDRYTNERHIIPLINVSLVAKRCEACEGTGELRLSKWFASSGEIFSCKLTKPCLVCQGSGKASES